MSQALCYHGLPQARHASAFWICKTHLQEPVDTSCNVDGLAPLLSSCAKSQKIFPFQ